jgi:short subunit dehydrogenase-like uncharacterized protein
MRTDPNEANARTSVSTAPSRPASPDSRAGPDIVISAASDRDYDVLLYGAGGFTGRQTVAYFATHAPAGLRWAIAGPRRHTLEAARAAAGARLSDTDLIVAPSQDQAAVDAVVARSRVVLSTAGPFALYGTPVVDACVRFGTDYVDITGETPWTAEIADRYHAPAAAVGTRIIPCCGFDSVPSDLGALLMTRYIREELRIPCAEVRAYYQFSGGLNGGTVASLLNMLNMPRRGDAETTPPQRRDGRIRMVKAPCYDAELGTWIGPFVMAPTNTQVVRRSIMLSEEWQQSYAPNFVYQEAMRYDPPLARARATAASAGLGLLFAALKQPLTRRLLQRLLPKPGTGPSVETMDAGWFTCDLLGIAEDGRQVRGLIRYNGDPGNRATTVFLCESALALAIDADALPGARARGGVLTPATGLGDVLVERLRKAGTVIDIPRSSVSGH